MSNHSGDFRKSVEVKRRFGERRERPILGNCIDCARPLYRMFDDGRCAPCHFVTMHVQREMNDSNEEIEQYIHEQMSEAAFERALRLR